MTKVGLIGLGAMGAGMAANLARAGGEVWAFDLSPAALERAASEGCRPASSAAELAANAETIITMLPAGGHVRKVWTEAILPNARPGSLLIDCSTIDVKTAEDMAVAAVAAGMRAGDAPVSGGIAAAQGGTLAFMVGCANESFGAIETALKPMARAIIHAGQPGAGQAAKICNNMLLGISMAGVCEAFALAEKLGLDPLRFFEIASQSSGQCWSLTSYSPWPGPVPAAPSNRGYEGGFLASLMSKDLKLAQDAAARAGAATPMGAVAQSIYALFETQGYGHKDFSALLQMLRGRLSELDAPAA